MKINPADAPGASEASAAAITAIIPAMQIYAMARLRSKAHAQDAVQDALERAWKARETFRPGASLKGWMFRILRNQMIDTFRKNKPLSQDVDGNEAAKLVTPAEQLVRLEYADLLCAMDKLTPDMRQALLLAGLGMTHVEAATMMGIPLGTFKSHVRRGRVRLE